MNEEIIEYISYTVDNVDKIIQYLSAYKEKSREQYAFDNLGENE